MQLIPQSRLSDADAARYPYGDEWYAFDESALLSKPSSELIALEAAMDGYTIGDLLVGISRRSTGAMRAALWIARKLTHHDIEKYADFDPVVWLAQTRVVDEHGNVVTFDEDGDAVAAEQAAEPAEGDADPLGGGSPAADPSPPGS